MVATRSLTSFTLLALLCATAAAPPAPSPRALRLRRQLADDDALQPIEDGAGEEQAREKRKLEGVTQVKFGIKNAVLGFVFGSGTTWRRRELAREPPSWSRSPGRPLSPGGPRSSRQAVAADDIPVFDRNKVSLDLPGSLFGPSVSLLIRTTKIVGDVIQNSAVRYQTFLRLFRPLFRGPFEIKGLDPPTTTTTTTTTTTARTTTAADSAADNEVRRR